MKEKLTYTGAKARAILAGDIPKGVTCFLGAHDYPATTVWHYRKATSDIVVWFGCNHEDHPNRYWLSSEYYWYPIRPKKLKISGSIRR